MRGDASKDAAGNERASVERKRTSCEGGAVKQLERERFFGARDGCRKWRSWHRQATEGVVDVMDAVLCGDGRQLLRAGRTVAAEPPRLAEEFLEV